MTAAQYLPPNFFARRPSRVFHGLCQIGLNATVAEYIAGKPLKDAGKEQRWQNYWDPFVSRLDSAPLDHQVCETAGELLAAARRAGKTVPLGDGLHAAVADLEDLTVATVEDDHFKALGVRAVNPLK